MTAVELDDIASLGLSAEELDVFQELQLAVHSILVHCRKSVSYPWTGRSSWLICATKMSRKYFYRSTGIHDSYNIVLSSASLRSPVVQTLPAVHSNNWAGTFVRWFIWAQGSDEKERMAPLPWYGTHWRCHWCFTDSIHTIRMRNSNTKRVRMQSHDGNVWLSPSARLC